MTLAQRRVLQDFETNQFPALKSQIDEAAGFAIPVEVNWESLAVPGEEHNYKESWPQIYFEPLIEGLKHLTRDEMGRDAIKSGIKQIVVQNVKGCDYGTCWAGLNDGVLTLDHSFSNAYDVQGRKNGLVALLEQSL